MCVFLGACYYDSNQSMYVFGGCTQSSCNAAFNDLWRLDLNSKEWIRPLASGLIHFCLCFITARDVQMSVSVVFVQVRTHHLKPEPLWSCIKICWFCSAAGRDPVPILYISLRDSLMRSTRTRRLRTGERNRRSSCRDFIVDCCNSAPFVFSGGTV